MNIILGGGPAPGQKHTDYVAQLSECLEKAYEVVRVNLGTAQRYQKSTMTEKLLGGVTNQETLCGSTPLLSLEGAVPNFTDPGKDHIVL